MRAIPTRSWVWAAVLSCGCNALLGIDEPRTVSPDAAIVFDAKPPTYDAPIGFDALGVTPDAPRTDAPLAVDAKAADAAPADAATVDGAVEDAAEVDGP